MRKKYIYRPQISKHKFRLILRFFFYDIESKTTSQFTGISRPTINKIREHIAKECKKTVSWAKVKKN